MNWERSDIGPRGAIDRVLAGVGYSAVIESIVLNSECGQARPHANRRCPYANPFGAYRGEGILAAQNCTLSKNKACPACAYAPLNSVFLAMNRQGSRW